MYAIVELGGRQWKVEPGTHLQVNRLSTAVGGQHSVDRILLAHDGQTLHVGRPYVQGAKVICEVVANRLGSKVISYYFRRRENWRKTVGHRQPLTQLLVKEIVVNGTAMVEAPAREQAPQKAPSRPKAHPPKAAAPKGAAKTAAPKKTPSAAPKKSTPRSKH